MIKLIATDLDGTLLTRGGISKENLAAIHYAKVKGVKLVLATGRDYSMIEPMIEKYQLDCMSITGNGAEFRNEEGDLLERAYFNLDYYLSVTKILKEEELPFMVYTTEGFYSEDDPIVVIDAFIERTRKRFRNTDEQLEKRREQMACMHLKKIQDIDGFIKKKPQLIKIEAFTIDNTQAIKNAKEKFGQIPGISYLSSFIDNVEITDLKAQKGIILEEACKKLGVKQDEVMVLGDGMNDISMFERFQYSFAPANSQKEILEAAYCIVKSCEEDGFSEAVYKMVK